MSTARRTRADGYVVPLHHLRRGGVGDALLMVTPRTWQTSGPDHLERRAMAKARDMVAVVACRPVLSLSRTALPVQEYAGAIIGMPFSLEASRSSRKPSSSGLSIRLGPIAPRSHLFAVIRRSQGTANPPSSLMANS